MADARSLADAIAAGLAADPARPALVHRDERDGTRVELSVASLANAVAKASGLAADDPPGATVALALPPHWISCGLLLGCWLRGLVPVLDPDETAMAEAAWAVLGPGTVAAGGSLPDLLPDRTYVSRLHPFGLGLAAELPWHVEDLTPAWRAGPDRIPPPLAVPADAVALRIGGQTWTSGQLLAATEPAGAGRRLATAVWDSADAVVAATLTPLVRGGTAVLVTGLEHPLDEAAVERLRRQEHAA